MRFSVLGIPIDSLTPQKLYETLLNWLTTDSPHIINTPNAEMIVASQYDIALAKRLNQADLCLPDSASLHYAIAALTGDRLENRHTGIDTLRVLAELCENTSQRLVLFGGENQSSEKAVAELLRAFPQLDIVAFEGEMMKYLQGTVAVSESIIHQLQTLKPVVLAVALGHGKQEAFLELIKSHLPTLKIGIGVGGAFELISGELPRAPKWMRRFGFEWLWRLYLQPKRLPRIARAVIVFPSLILYDAFQKRRFFKAIWRVLTELFRQFSRK